IRMSFCSLIEDRPKISLPLCSGYRRPKIDSVPSEFRNCQMIACSSFVLPRFLCSAGILLFVTGFAHGQDRSADAKKDRYVPIPLQGDIEALLRDRLRLAEENDSLRKLLADLRKRHLELGLDPGQLDKLDLENATFRSLLKEMLKL